MKQLPIKSLVSTKTHYYVLALFIAMSFAVGNVFYNNLDVAKADTVQVDCSGTAASPTSVDEASLSADDVTFADAGGDGYCEVDAAISAATVTVNSGVVITHPAGDADGIDITTTGAMTINGWLDADEKGCLSQSGSSNGYGPNGSNACSAGTAGAGAGSGSAGGMQGAQHGAWGGSGSSPLGFTGNYYGSATAPVLFGSSGGSYSTQAIGGAGGGKIVLDVGGTLTLSGLIVAQGGNGSTYSSDTAGGGGSGGSIYITADKIDGSGDISVIGGAGATNGSVGGGGGSAGRIAIIIDDDTGTHSLSIIDIMATGGSGGTNGTSGEKGTIYVRDMNGDGAIDSDDDVTIMEGFTYSSGTLSFDTLTVNTGSTSQYCDYGLSSGSTVTLSGTTSITMDSTLLCSVPAGSISNFSLVAPTVTFNANSDFQVNATSENISPTGNVIFSAGASFDNLSGASTISPTGTLTINNDVTLRSQTNLTLGAATDFALSGTGVTLQSDTEGSTITVEVPDSDTQTWTNLTVNTEPESTFYTDSNFSLTLAGTTDINSNVEWTNLINFTQNSGTTIDAVEHGCQAEAADGYGPNGSNVCTSQTAGWGDGDGATGGYQGAGHGSTGGLGSTVSYNAGGAAYGSATAPVLYGSSGGGWELGRGGAGGGLIQITASGTFTHNGIIRADGGDGTAHATLDYAGAGGSGGSINIATSTYTCATGTFSSTGGDGSTSAVTAAGGGGAGGRLLVSYVTDSSGGGCPLSGLSAGTETAAGTGGTGGSSGSNGGLVTGLVVACSGTSGSPTAVTETSLSGKDVIFADAGGGGYCQLDEAVSAASVIVGSGVTLTHPAEDADGVTITTTGNFDLQSGATINVSTKGCQAALNTIGRGPNSSNVCTDGAAGASVLNDGTGGAGHGAVGGNGNAASGGAIYGDPTAPVLQGSSAGSNPGQISGDGGGMVHITAGGTTTLNGSITANGGNGNGAQYWYGSAGGSGGSIYIEANGTITGTPTLISVNGGSANNTGAIVRSGGGGSGGRIAIVYNNESSFSYSSSTVTSNLGTGVNNGNQGSVYVRDMNGDSTLDTDDDVVIMEGFTYDATDYNVNSWTFDSSATSQNCDPNNATDASPSVTVPGTLTFVGNFTCTNQIGSFTLNGASVAMADNSYLNINGAITLDPVSGALDIGDGADIISDGTITMDSPTSFSLGSDVIITNATLNTDIIFDIPAGDDQIWDNVDITGPAEGELIMDDAIAITLTNDCDLVTNVYFPNLTAFSISDSSSNINASSKGCITYLDQDGYGPDGSNICVIDGQGSGHGLDDASGTGGGAHGGNGGDGNRHPGGFYYDSLTAPILFGASGGSTGSTSPFIGGTGGGRVHLGISGTLTNNGTISANGGNGQGSSYWAGVGGGGGGTVYVNTDTITGTGTFNANGGNGTYGTVNHGGGGGGGIISIIYNTNSGYTFNATNVNAHNGTGINAGGKGLVHIRDDDSNDVMIIDGYRWNDTDYSYNSLTIDTSATGMYCETDMLTTSTPSITTVADITLNGTLSCSPTAGTFTSWDVIAPNITFGSNSSYTVNAGTIDLTLAGGNILFLSGGKLYNTGGTTTLVPSGTFGLAGSNVVSSKNTLTIDPATDLNFNGTGNTITVSTKNNDLLVDVPAADTTQTWSGLTVNVAAEGEFIMDDAVDLTITGNSAINSSVNWTNLSSFQIDSGSSVNANSKGCLSVLEQNGYGPNGSNICTVSTAGYTTNDDDPGGAGHGGVGGNGNSTGIGGATYGSATNPVLFGSSSGANATNYLGGSGGGLILIESTGTFTHNGTLTANGGNGPGQSYWHGSGGGSGGSINITTDEYTCATGVFSADGGNGAGEVVRWGGSGAGGRVAIDYNTDNSGGGCPITDLTLSSVVAGGTVTNYGGYGTLRSGCGDKVLEGAEECDDGNRTAGDGCSATCTIEETCGDGFVLGSEECDDGGTANGDGCNNSCQLDKTGFASSHRIRLFASQVDDNLTDFPVLLADDNFLDAVYDNTLSNGSDIFFTSDEAGANPIPFEVVNWDTSGKTSQVWVKVPSLSSSTDTIIYVWYNNASATNLNHSAGSVWSDYFGVWHLDEQVTDEQTSGEHYDSTSYSNDGSQNNNAYNASGKIGGAQTFDGTSDYISVPNTSASLNFTGPFTLSAWANRPSTSTSSARLIVRELPGNRNPYITYGFWQSGTSNDLAFGVATGGTGALESITTSADPPFNQWMQLTGVYTGTQEYFYVNDTLNNSRDTGVDNTMLITDTPFVFGGNTEINGEWYNGSFDEIRIYDGVLSSEWISTSYNNQNDPSSFALAISGVACTDPDGDGYGSPSTDLTGCSGSVLLEDNCPTVSNPDQADSDMTQPNEISGLELWLKADSLTGYSDGDTVGTWVDQSENGYNFTQGTESRKPKYYSNQLNGKPVVRFTASEQDTMTNSNNFSSPVTVVYVARQTGGANARVLSGLSNNWLLGYYNGNRGRAYYEGWISTLSNSVDTDWHTYSTTISGSVSTVWEDGTQIASVGGSHVGPNGISLNGHQGNSEFSNAEIAEVLVYNRSLSSSEVREMETYLDDKYNLGTANTLGSMADGIGDVCDNCWLQPNENQEDTNANCPLFPFLTSPLCGDACDPCGNGTLDGGEECDDSNQIAGDGCSINCAIESGWACESEPSSCHTITCGDGLLEGSESCDDGNTDNGDGCDSSCNPSVTGFASSLELTIDSDLVDEALTNFPIVLKDGSFPPDVYNNTETDGSDLLFSTDVAGNTIIPHELVSWDTTAKTGEVWVEIPSVSDTVDTSIYVWYNNASAIAPDAAADNGVNNMWDGYVGVWHMEDDPLNDDFTGTSLDSTKWNNGGAGFVTMTVNDNIYFSQSSYTAGWTNKWIQTKDYFDGNFDIQLDYSDLVRGSSSDGGLGMFACTSGGDDCFYIRRQLNNQRYDSDKKINGVWGGGHAYTSTTDTSGKLRFFKRGSTLTSFRWNGSGWSQVHSITESEYNQPMYILIEHSFNNGNGNYVRIDNFRVNHVTDSTTNNLTGNGHTYSGAGILGASQDYDGVINWTYLQDNDLYNLSNITISGWSKYEGGTPSDYYGIFSSYAGGDVYQHYGLRMSNTGYGSFFYDDGSEWDGINGSSYRIDDNQWHYLAGTMESATAGKIYVDGTLDGTDTSSIPTSVSPTNHFYIGIDGQGQAEARWNGKLDEMRIYDGVRSEGWLSTEYNNQLSPYQFIAAQTCGNGNVELTEECDDGDTDAGDGCSATCTVEGGYVCSGLTPTVCSLTCGNGTIEGADQCDDSNTNNGDGCDSSCQLSVTGYANSLPIVIDSDQVDDNLTDFPVLIKDSVLPSSFYSNVETDGKDILFSTDVSGNTIIPHEVAYLNTGTQKTEIWVSVPSLSSSTDTTIYIWYNNSSAIAPNSIAENYKTNVWDGYAAVWHLNEDVNDESTAGTHYDATANNNDGTQGSNVEISGKIGNAQNFDGNDNITVGHSSSLSISDNSMSIELWAKGSASAQWDSPIQKTSSSSWADGYGFYDNGAGSLCFYVTNYSGNVSCRTFSDGAWHHVVGNYNGSNVTIYIDNVAGGSDSYTGNISTNGSSLLIGNAGGGSYHWPGDLDEIRVSDSSRSAGWITTSYNNQNSPSTFISSIECGDGVIAGAEQCDDGNTSDNDGCSATCQLSIDGFERKQSITFDADLIDENLTDFPVLLADAVFSSDVYANTETDGKDLMFSTDIDGINIIPHEVVNWNTGGETSEVWVKVPSLSSSADTTIYVWYGNTNASAPLVNADNGSDNVWSEYAGVWHLDESVTDEQTSGTHYDATSNSNDGQQFRSSYVADAKIGSGQYLDGSNDYINIPHSSSLNLNGPFTLSMWVNRAQISPSVWAHYMAKGASGGSDPWVIYGMYQSNNTADIHFATSTGGAGTQENVLTSADPPIGSWFLLTTVYNGTQQYLYINDALNNSRDMTVDNTMATNTIPLVIGAEPQVSAKYLQANVDEVRVDPNARTIGWVKAMYNNQNDPATFASAGTPRSTDPIPLYSNFSVPLGTTDFSGLGAWDTIGNMKLANIYGSMTWAGANVNAEEQDFDSYARIGSGFVSLDTANLHDTIHNDSSTVSGFSTRVELQVAGCESFTAYYADAFYNSLTDIKTNGQVCNASTTPACTNISCLDNTLSFNVPHFDSYGGEGSPLGISTTAGVANEAPYITATPSDGGSTVASPTNVGSDIDFSVTAKDSHAHQYYLAICKTDAVTAGNATAPTCDGGAWVISVESDSEVAANVSYTTQGSDGTSNDWYAFVCDKVSDDALCYPANGSGDQGLAAGTVTFSDIPEDGVTVTIDSITYEFDTAGDGVTGDNTEIDTASAQSTVDVADFLKAAEAGTSSHMEASLNVTFVYADATGTAGNSIGMTEANDTSDYITLSGATLVGGSDDNASPFVVNQPPTFGTVTATDDSDGTIEPGDTLKFTLPSAEIDDDENVIMHICTEATTSFDYATDTCTDGATVCSSSAVNPDTTDATCTGGASLITVPTAHGSHNYKVYVEDAFGVGGTGTNSQTYAVQDVPPTLVSYTASDNPAPVAGGSDTVDFSAVIADDNGDTDVTAVEGVFFDDSAVNNDCTADENNCYIDADCTISDTGDDDELTASCQVTVWFNANASSNWEVHVKPTDELGQVTDLANSSVGIANPALQGIDIVEANIAYSTVLSGRVSERQQTSMGNVGNQTLDVFIDGEAMCNDYPTCSGGTIGLGQQKWYHEDTDFAWSASPANPGPYTLQDVASGTDDETGCLNRDIAVRDDHSSTTTNESIWWKLMVPESTPSGSYSGETSFAATPSSTCSSAQSY